MIKSPASALPIGIDPIFLMLGSDEAYVKITRLLVITYIAVLCCPDFCKKPPIVRNIQISRKIKHGSMLPIRIANDLTSIEKTPLNTNNVIMH